MDAEIKQYIDVMAENTALKIEKKIDDSICSHSEHCVNQFSGRMAMVEDAVISLAKKSESRFDSFGPLLAGLLKNWKAAAVAAIIAVSAINGIRSGKSYTIEDIKEIVKQVQSTEVSEKQVGTAPKEADKIVY